MTIDNVQPHRADDYDRTMPAPTVRPLELTRAQRFVRKLKIGY